MTMAGWNTVWAIAASRDQTKQGSGHLSEHAHEVLQAFVVNEAHDAMRSAMGSAFFFFSE